MKPLAVAGIAAAAFLTVSIVPASAQEVAGAAGVTGAGSTFAYPIISKWSKAYQRWVAGGGDFPAANSGLDDPPTGPVLDYEPTGSLAGTMRVREGAVDFGASDMPLRSEELRKLGLGQFPIVIGGVVAAVNIDGIGPGEIKFTGELLADIFLGQVDTWAHPAIRALNPDLKLPDAKIVVVRRADGSGTTFNFTHYLSTTSARWRTEVGSDLVVRWPTGIAAKGNEGVSQAVKQTKNSIGYVEYARAVQMKLSYGLIQNRAGRFVRPNAASFQAAAANADWEKASDFHLLLTDQPGEQAYPIVATVFAQMRTGSSARKARATFNFFRWSLDNGAKDAAELGYVPLPPALVTHIKGYWAKTFNAGT